MPNSSGTVRGSKIVPNVRPSAEHVTQASGVSVSSTSQCTWRWMWMLLACTTAAIGNTSAAASSPWSAPNGHLLQRDERDRQRCEHAILDLSRVAELLDHRQRDGLDALEHDRQPDHAGDEDGREGRLAGRAAASADPCPMVGKTYRKTKHSSSGWMIVRGMNSRRRLRSTTRSRSSSAPNAIRLDG